MLKKIKVGKKFIGPGEPTYIIAEIGINHEGDPDVCLKMIKEAAAAGADAIKLQTMDPDQNYSKETQSYKLFKKAWLSSEQTKNMFDYVLFSCVSRVSHVCCKALLLYKER